MLEDMAILVKVPKKPKNPRASIGVKGFSEFFSALYYAVICCHMLSYAVTLRNGAKTQNSEKIFDDCHTVMITCHTVMAFSRSLRHEV